MTAPLRFLLFQVRNPDDPMREHEVESFSRSLRCKRDHIDVFDLIGGVPSARQLDAVDVVLLGGSGDYSVAKGGPWLPEALEAMRQLHETSKPTFASCWGFQAMARAMGGEVVTDRDRLVKACRSRRNGRNKFRGRGESLEVKILGSQILGNKAKNLFPGH